MGGLKEKELPALLFTEHHQSHAASAFFPSPFGKAAVLCLDGVGKWATSSVWLGDGSSLTPQREIDFPRLNSILNAQQCTPRDVYTGFSCHCHSARFGRMAKLTMTPLHPHLPPAIDFEAFNQIPCLHNISSVLLRCY